MEGTVVADIVPRKVTGAALCVVDMASYVATSIQDVVCGWLIDDNSILVNIFDEQIKDTQYDFIPVTIFWVVVSVMSFMLRA